MTSGSSTWTSTSLSYPQTSMAVWAPSMAAAYGDRPAIVDGERVYSYRELDEESAQFARALASTGVEPGDVVLLHLGNCAEFYVAYYGALRVGAVVSPVNPLQPEPELRRRIEETGAVAAVTGQLHFVTLLRAQAVSSVGLIAVVSDESVRGGNPATMRFSDVIAGQRTSFTPATVFPDDVAHIAYTGGTTGISKGVRVLHRNVIGNITQMCGWRAGHRLVTGADGLVSLERIQGLDVDGVVPGVGSTIVVSPLFHAHALINTSFLLMCGLTQVLSGRFDPGRVLEEIEQHRASYITGTPAMWQALVTHPDVSSRDMSSVRVVSSGASPIDPGTLDSLRRAFTDARVVEGYGLTEATCLVTAAPLGADSKCPVGSAGLPVFDTQIQIRALDDPATILEEGERGELWVRGPQITDGYLGTPEMAARQFLDGWLATGDIAYRDADGFVYIVGRSKDMLVYKGYNVYPRLLEEVAASHPSVSSVAVVGRDVGAVGEEPVAFVVPAGDAARDSDELMAYVAERVLPYERIREVLWVDALPTSAEGKILRNDLRGRLRVKPVLSE